MKPVEGISHRWASALAAWLCVAAALLGGVGVSVPAHAAGETTIGTRLEAGPTFAGDWLLWGKRSREGRLALVARDPAGTTRPVFRVPPPPPAPPAPPLTYAESSNWIGGIAASRDFVAYEYGEGWFTRSDSARASSPVSAGGGWSRLMVGPRAGPFRRLSGDPESREPCTTEETDVSAFAFDGSKFAYNEMITPCSGPRISKLRVVVTNLATGDQLAELFPRPRGTPTDISISGRYLAFLDAMTYAPTAYVYEWATGTLVYKVRYPRGQIYLMGLGIRRDGSLVLLSSNQRRTRSLISVATAAVPRARSIVAADDIRELRLAGNRIFAVRGSGRQRSDETWTRFQPFVADFRGRVAELGNYGPRTHLVGKPDFNGRQAAWAIERRTRDGKRLRSIRLVDVESAWASRTKEAR